MCTLGSPITTTADENGHGNASSNNDEMSIVTLEPFITVTRGRGGRGGRPKHNNNRRNNIITNYPLLSNKGPTLKKFFVIKALNPNTENLWSTIDTIKANQDLKKSLGGNPRNVSELRNGTILVETENQIQSNKIMQLKTLAETQVQIAEHPNLNFSKGTIRAGEWFRNYDDDILKHELAQCGVVDLYKMKRKVEGSLKDTGTIILTFEGCNLPDSVKIGWNSYEVRQYIPLPRQCFKFQKFNHSSKTCRAEQDTCNTCGESGHAGTFCTKPLQCANCKKPHKSSDRQCPLYQTEKEILATQTTDRIPYFEAKKKIMKRFANQNQTFAEALKTINQNHSRHRLSSNTVNRTPMNTYEPLNEIREQQMESSNKRTISDTEENKRAQPTKKANHNISTDSSDDTLTVHSSKTPNAKPNFQFSSKPNPFLPPTTVNSEPCKITPNSSKTPSYLSCPVSESQSPSNSPQESEKSKTPTATAIPTPNIKSNKHIPKPSTSADQTTSTPGGLRDGGD